MQTIFKFPPDKYGYTANMCDHTVQTERKLYCKKINEPTHFPLSDIQHIEFEIELSEKYRKEFIEYLKDIGGLTIGLKTIEAQSKRSFLLSYYMERRHQNERKTAFSLQHGEARPDDVA